MNERQQVDSQYYGRDGAWYHCRPYPSYNDLHTLTQEITLLLVMMVTSTGIAGVARASLVVVAATLPMFNLPEAGLLQTRQETMTLW